MIYQRETDKVRERAVAAQLAEAWRCEAVEFPALSPIDWYLKRDVKLSALVEIKTRKRTRLQFPTALLDLQKLWALSWAAMAFSVPAFFVVAYTDGVFYIDVRTLTGAGLPVAVRGRTDRDNVHDLAPCVEIPVSTLRMVRVVPTSQTERHVPVWTI